MMRAIVFAIAGTVLLYLPVNKAYGETFFEEKNYDIDSLKQVLNTATGAERVKTLCLLAGQYRIDEADSSIVYAEEAFRLSRGTRDPKLDLLATYTLGLAYHHKGDYPQSVRYSLDAKEMALAQHDTMMFYQVMHCVAFSYLYSNNPDLFIEAVLETSKYLESWKDPARQFELEIRLGWSYMQIKQYRRAISYFLKAAAYADSANLISPPRVALNYRHTARCYLNIAQYDSVKIIIDLTEKYCILHNLNLADFVWGFKSDYFFNINAYDSALIYSRMMLDFSVKEGFIYGQARDLIRNAKIFKIKGETDLAVSFLKKSIEKAEWVCENKSDYLDWGKSVNDVYATEQSVPDYYERGGLNWLIQAHTSLYEIYKSRGDTKNALVHIEELDKARDRLRELDRIKDVMEVNTRYETERKKQQINLLMSENKLNAVKLEQTQYLLFALAGFILFAILVAILLVRQNRMKAMQDKKILEQRLLRAQMNPHFLYNSLASIQNFIVTEDPENASIYLSKFSSLVRSILESSNEEFVTLDHEIRLIGNYLALQKVRFEEKFDYTIDTDENLDTENLQIPPMLVQPFIENAIEHGIRHKKGKGRIQIRIERKDDSTIFEVEDDGIGRQKAQEILRQSDAGHKSMATDITRERIAALNKKHRTHITLEIIDLKGEKGEARGTLVRFEIPLV